MSSWKFWLAGLLAEVLLFLLAAVLTDAHPKYQRISPGMLWLIWNLAGVWRTWRWAEGLVLRLAAKLSRRAVARHDAELAAATFPPAEAGS